MVGVPGRSKGCKTCRRRRVKCDEAKPRCQRCIRAGFECLGYERETIWRNTSSAQFPQPQSMSSSIQNQVVIRARAGTPAIYADPPSPPRELSLVAFQDNIYLSFMFSNYIWRSAGTLWLPAAAEGKYGLLSLHAAHAVSEAAFGRIHHQSNVEYKGLIKYGQCLNALVGQIARPKRDSQALLVPMLLLLMHSASQSDHTGAGSHLKGIGELMQACGPHAFQQQPLLNAFEAARAVMITSSLTGRRRLFLEEEQWRMVPWLQDPESKSQQSKLLDILVIVPGILQDYTEAHALATPEPVQYRNLLQKVKIQLMLLYSWRWRWQARYAHEVQEDTNCVPPIFVTTGGLGRLHFRRFAAAVELMIYNATLTWLLALLFKLEPLGATKEIMACAAAARPKDEELSRIKSFQSLQRPGEAITLRGPALEICRAFDWVTRNHNDGTEQTHMYLFPVGTAMTALQGDHESLVFVRWLYALNESAGTASHAEGAHQAVFGFPSSRDAFADMSMSMYNGGSRHLNFAFLVGK